MPFFRDGSPWRNQDFFQKVSMGYGYEWDTMGCLYVCIYIYVYIYCNQLHPSWCVIENAVYPQGMAIFLGDGDDSTRQPEVAFVQRYPKKWNWDTNGCSWIFMDLSGYYHILTISFWGYLPAICGFSMISNHGDMIVGWLGSGSSSKTGWWFGTWILFFHILGMSSSQLANSLYHFSEGLVETTNQKTSWFLTGNIVAGGFYRFPTQFLQRWTEETCWGRVAQHTLGKLGMVHGYKTNVELLVDLNFVSNAL